MQRVKSNKENILKNENKIKVLENEPLEYSINEEIIFDIKLETKKRPISISLMQDEIEIYKINNIYLYNVKENQRKYVKLILKSFIEEIEKKKEEFINQNKENEILECNNVIEKANEFLTNNMSIKKLKKSKKIFGDYGKKLEAINNEENCMIKTVNHINVIRTIKSDLIKNKEEFQLNILKYCMKNINY